MFFQIQGGSGYPVSWGALYACPTYVVPHEGRASRLNNCQQRQRRSQGFERIPMPHLRESSL